MKVFAENRKARNSYNFEEFYEAGIVLTGPETKSVRGGAVSIVDAFAVIENEEAFIYEMNIEPYKFAQQADYDPKSRRKLLLHKNEIKRFINLIDTFYETKKILFILAESAPKDIMIGGKDDNIFQRTVSRLEEMQSAEYLNNIIEV